MRLAKLNVHSTLIMLVMHYDETKKDWFAFKPPNTM